MCWGVLAGAHSSLGWQTGWGPLEDQSLELSVSSQSYRRHTGLPKQPPGQRGRGLQPASARLGAEPAQIPAGKGADRWKASARQPSRGQVGVERI